MTENSIYVLFQLGPETNIAGGLIQKEIDRSSDLDRMKMRGCNIAAEYRNHDAMWAMILPSRRRLQMEVREDIFLLIEIA